MISPLIFIAVDAANVDREVDNMLERFASFFGLDRSYLFIFDAESESMNLRNEWSKPKVTRQSSLKTSFSVQTLPWWFNLLLRKDYVMIPELSQIPVHTERTEFAQTRYSVYVVYPYF